MKRLCMAFTAMLFVFVMGCTEGQDTAETQQPDKSQEEREEKKSESGENGENQDNETHQPVDQDQETEKPQADTFSANITTIQLEDETKLKSPRRIIVSSAKSHQFSVQFLKPVNQKSVEEQLESKLPDQTEFSWADDQHLKLKIPPIEWSGTFEREFTIDVNGALTASGKKMVDQDTFSIILSEPRQLWGYSLNSEPKKLSSFDRYFFNIEPLNQDTFILHRSVGYCECDREYDHSTYLYETGKEPVYYPEGIQSNLLTDEPFIVDPRGFFLPGDSPNFDPENQYRIEPNGFVGGAKVLGDGENLVMAVGESEKDQPLDLVILHMPTGKEEVFEDVIPGIRSNQIHGGPEPVIFSAVSENKIAFTAQGDPVSSLYLFDMGNGSAEEVQTTFAPYFNRVFSADGTYRFVYNEGIYKGDELVKPLNQGEFIWSSQGNQFIYQKSVDYENNIDEYVLASVSPEKEYSFTIRLHEEVVGFTPDNGSLIVMKQAD